MKNSGKQESGELNQTLVRVELEQQSYDIVIGERILANAGTLIHEAIAIKRAIIVTDEHVASRYLHRLTGALAAVDIRAATIILQAGEKTKTPEQLMKLTSKILEQAPDRATGIIALGGGVIGDITGCAASLALRGLPLVQIPTTLLAQVDSSVGGKTGVNTSYGKNTLGTFYQPKLVIIDTTTLETLPRRELLAGYAEIVKYGAIGDLAFFDWLETNGNSMLAQNADTLQQAIAKSCQAKAAIVKEDEKEVSGKRALLNFGHTFGHALEAETGFSQTLLHGEAVAIGMVLAAQLSHHLGRCSDSVATRIQAHLASIGLRTHMNEVQPLWNVDALMAHMAHDKKADYNSLNFILLNALGDAEFVKNIPSQAVHEILQKAIP